MKFIQITAAPTSDQYTTMPSLFALDEEGHVYQYVYASVKGSYWARLPEKVLDD